MALKHLSELPLLRKVLLPDHEDYETSNNTYFTKFESEIRPSCIVQPTSASEVSSVITGLRPALLQSEIKLAVRGTGHTPFACSANIDGGVTLDLRYLKGITLNEDKSIVTIAVGETWSSVYDELEKHGLTTAGGRAGRVGVAGLILGGGLSMYSTKRGFACDSVLDFEVVLASGKIIHANAKENPDLFTSLKGGLNNFGIVTSMQMKTFETSNIWGGITYYMSGTFEHLIKETVDFVLNETDQDTHIMSSTGYAFGHEVVTCCMYQTQGVENAPSLQRFTAIPNQIEAYNTMRTSTHISFCNELSSFTKDGVRSFYATCTIRPDCDLMNQLHRAWQETLETLKPIPGIIFSLGFFPLTKSTLQASKLAGGNAKDIDPADGPLFIILFNPTWDSADDDDRVHKEVRDLLARFKKLAGEKGLLHRYLFTNYAYQDEDVFGGYSEKSLQLLREVSKMYDPERIFQDAVPGGFKLWK